MKQKNFFQTRIQEFMDKLDWSDYGKHDHVHCWQSKNPPCGQKIEHLKCCLCEKLNPKVSEYCNKKDV